MGIKLIKLEVWGWVCLFLIKIKEWTKSEIKKLKTHRGKEEGEWERLFIFLKNRKSN